MVKLKDIAEACGVSAATVSRALNGVTDPERKNTAFILRIAKEMGYFPNAAARTLKTSRSNSIGILYEDRMDHEYYSLLLNELRFAAEDQGYDLTFIQRTLHDPEAGDYSDRARRRSLDGVVVVQADFNSADVMRLAAGSIPTVVIDHVYEGCDCVMCDNRTGMEALGREAWEKRHRKIACIHGEDGTVTRERMTGFYKARAELGIRVPADFVRSGHFLDPESCALIVSSLMQAEETPACILCPDDFSCLSALKALKEMGLRAARDVSLAGYDGIRMGQMLHPKLTAPRQDAPKAALETMVLLLDAIENPEIHQPRRVVVAGEILTGEALLPAYTIEITAIRVNGEEIAFEKGYTSSDDGIVTRMNIYNEWVGEVPADARSFDGITEDAKPVIVDKELFAAVKTAEVDEQPARPVYVAAPAVYLPQFLQQLRRHDEPGRHHQRTVLCRRLIQR